MDLTELFTSTADAIRTKKGTTEKIKASDFPNEISSIESGIDTSDATATASDMAKGTTAYVNGEKITGTVDKIPEKSTIATASDYINLLGNKIHLMGNFPSDVIIPKTSYVDMQGSYSEVAECIGLTADKIIEGETVLGIEGTASAGTDTTDATATASDMAQGTTAYVNGEKITGTIPVRKAETIEQTSWVVGGNGAEIYIDTQLPEKSIVDTDVVIRNKASQDLLCGMCTVDATATAEDIAEGKTAYVKGERIVGTASAGGGADDYLANTMGAYYSGSMDLQYPLLNIIKKLPDGFSLKPSTFQGVQRLFYYATALTVVPPLNFEDVVTTNAKDMCRMCSSLVTFPTINLGDCINMTDAFRDCRKLENIGGFIDLGKGYTTQTSNNSNYKLDLSASKVITHDSLMNVFNNLYDLNLTYDVANGGTLYTQSLVVGSINQAKLEATEEGQQALAELALKGWTVS